MLTIGLVVLGVDDLARATGFWMNALGYLPRAGSTSDDWAVLEPTSGSGTPIALDVSETPVQEYPRIHLDLFVSSEAEQTAEVDRLVSLGARLVDWDLYPEDPDFVVLAGTEGNIFCLVDTSRT